MRASLSLIGVLVALALPASAAAYPWPFKPFDRQHPIRGYFGDPRTVFGQGVLADGIDGPGIFSFHQGIDISAPNGTPIYSVSNGTAHYLGAQTLDVDTGRGVVFQYFHIVPVVGEGQDVRRSATVLGYVQAPFEHVHLTEIIGGRAVNPLLPGRLAPYTDRTRPTIRVVAFRNDVGAAEVPLGLCGRVEIDAQTYDTPPLRVPGPFDGLPVAPALVTWTIARAGGRAVVKTQTAADFRRMLPANRRFWDVYARGTYENGPRFGHTQYTAMPGRYVFRLAPSFDTRRLRNGVYVLTVRAADIRGNTAVVRRRFSVLNGRGSCPGSLPAPPGEPPPGEPPPVSNEADTQTGPDSGVGAGYLERRPPSKVPPGSQR